MTKYRAQYLLKTRGKFGEFQWAFECPLTKPPYYLGERQLYIINPNGIYESEWNYIKMVWSCMRQDQSFTDAVEAIAGGV